MDAFDADVLLYAALPDHPLGRRIRPLLDGDPTAPPIDRTPIGSVVLLPEVLSTALRLDRREELRVLTVLLGRLELHPFDRATAELATSLGARFGLRAADAAHLATAVAHGADRFLTNSAADFARSIDVIDITYPGDLPDPTT